MTTYWQEYYEQNKKRILKKQKEWRTNNPEKYKEFKKITRERRIEKYRALARERYRIWISIEENRKHKKEYQKLWWKTKYEAIKEEKDEFKEIERVLEKGKSIINGYEVELKTDNGGQWFYSLRQNGVLVYISDKFSTKKDLIKDLQYAV